MLRLRMHDEKGEFPVVDGIYEDADRAHAEDRAVRLACNEPNVRYLLRDSRLDKEVFSAKLEVVREPEEAGSD